MYKLIGTDGKEYGPATADQVRRWIQENRVEVQTPVFVAGIPEWTFVGLLPEFANDFPGPPRLAGAPPAIIRPLPPSRSYSMAKAALLCGILSITCGCCCAGLPFNVLGLVFSVIALVQISENPQRHGGAGVAVLGLVLSLVGLLVLGATLVVH